ncbi:MAG: hypothetical protein HYU51_00495 [Candidatus Rokubacteria bacterium]|nr:hypothetical protein [Candidatus Rokubacteria bacterium]
MVDLLPRQPSPLELANKPRGPLGMLVKDTYWASDIQHLHISPFPVDFDSVGTMKQGPEQRIRDGTSAESRALLGSASSVARRSKKIVIRHEDFLATVSR